ncbi:hypothetical protein [Bradyrhizobium elkanii]|uniref:hypothetical protein n=1 Tax=Bradyrhizobium elkanii TaxID=29448 RepID=UPI003D237D03
MAEAQKKPWFKFYPQDWRGDAKLRMCSIAARGLWAEMLCVMHEADPYGHLIIGGKPVSTKQMASLAGIPLAECTKLMVELEMAGVYSRSADGKTIHSRRMVRDKAKADLDRKNGKGGGNPKLKDQDNGGVNPPDKGEDKAQIPEARKHSEASASGASAPDDPRTRLFREGLAKLADLTGKGPDACRSFVGKCLQAAGDDAVTVLGLIYEADRNRVAHPAAWISARLKGQQNGSTGQVSAAADNLIERVKRGFGGAPSEGGSGIGAGQADARLLSYGRG